MRLIHSLRYKLIVAWVGSILTMTAMLVVAFYYLQEHNITNATLEKIETSFIILKSEIKSRKDVLEKNTAIIAGRNDIVSSVNLISSYQDTENYLPSVFDEEKQNLSREITKQARASDLDMLVVHDNSAFLAAYYDKKGVHGAQSGYQSFRNGKPVLVTASDDDDQFRPQGKPSDFLKKIMSTSEDEEHSVLFLSEPWAVIFESHAPIVQHNPDGTEQTVGLVHAAYLMDATFISDVSKSTGLELAIILPNGGRLGQLENAFLGNRLAEFPPLDGLGTSDEPFRDISTDKYVLGAMQISIPGNQRILFVFGKNKSELVGGITEFEQSIYVVLLLALVTIIPGASYYLNRSFLRPIQALMSGVEHLRRGDYSTLSGFDRDDELSKLAHSFNEMAMQIELRENSLRESEERFSAFINYTPIKLHIKDTKGRYILINRKSEELFGVSNEEAKGKTAAEIFPSDMSGAYDAHDRAVIQSGKPTEQEENFPLNGTVHSYLTVKFPILGADGSIVAVGSTGIEITKYKHMQAQLIQASKLSTLGEMSTGMAHELSQPLNIIHMISESLMETIDDGDISVPVVSTKLKKIINQTERAAAIINHMRIFGRIGSIELEEVDLQETVQGAIGLVQQQMRLAEIDLSFDFPQSCRKVIGQQLHLEQVVLNLLKNASDAIEEFTNNANKQNNGDNLKQIIIKIIDDPQSENVKLTMQDTGGGIPDQVIGRIFEPFFTTKEVGRGTGLGLSISYGIITEMGGEIDVANSNGGAIFTISLAANPT